MRTQIFALISLLAIGSTAIPVNGRPQLHQRLRRQAVNGGATAAGAAPAYTPAPQSAAPAQPSYAAPSGPASQPSAAPSTPSAAPAPYSGGGGSSGGAGGDTFQISIQNNCPSDLQFGIYQVSASFAMNQISSPVSIASGGSGSIAAPFQGIGMRLSATAGDGAAAQWNPQALFEFGYSTYNGMDGTAYDLSVMQGADSGTGVAVYPANSACPSKVCTPSNCAAGQGWTNPDQVNQGSPADTVCYQGKTDFKVVWCP